MKHYSYEEWMTYVKNEVDKETRVAFENHLYNCDQCLNSYLQAVAEVENDLPIIENEAEFTNLVMAQIAESKLPSLKVKKERRKTGKPFYQTAIFHYSVAAAMTILLMSTGVFQSITKYTESVQMPSIHQKELSVTEGLVNKTFAWMDSLDKKSKGAKK